MQTPWGECDVADAHVHFFSHRFFSALCDHCRVPIDQVAAKLGWELPSEDPIQLAARWTAELDRHGVSRAALIASAYSNRAGRFGHSQPVGSDAIDAAIAARGET